MPKNVAAGLARRPVTWLVLTAGVVVVVVGLAFFQPWKLWVDQIVDEPPPAAATNPATAAAPQAAPKATTIAKGTFVSHEHDTTGTVHIVREPDGSRYLRLEDLDTSNGPLLKVWLTDAPVLPGKDGWHVFDDGRHVDLGRAQGQQGQPELPDPRRRRPRHVPQRLDLVRAVPRVLRRRATHHLRRSTA